MNFYNLLLLIIFVGTVGVEVSRGLTVVQQINNYSKYTLIGDIQSLLIKVGCLAKFEASYFEHLLWFDSGANLCGKILIRLIGQDITVSPTNPIEH